MSYQATLNSRNVLVPIALEDRHGGRMLGPLAKLDTATAMMIQVSTTGGFVQEFFPLRIRQDSTLGYTGTEWELWAQKTGEGLFVHYIGIPDRFFSEQAAGLASRSLSVQVVGTSPLTGREDFSGGVDITLQAQVELPLIPGFLNLSERFFPTLLPQNFIESNVLDVFSFQGKHQLLLLCGLQQDPADRIPVSLEKHWDSKSWIGAVVENVSTDRYFTIRGGCFYARNRKITHWFGGKIGLEERDFRNAAKEKILSMGPSGNGSWIFWLEPEGKGSFDPVVLTQTFMAASAIPGGIGGRVSIRHPMMHQLLGHTGGIASRAREPSVIGDIPGEDAIRALVQVAGILASHQVGMLRARLEPTHALWSDLTGHPKSNLEAFGGGTSEPKAERRIVPRVGLDSDIRELYRRHGETLRALEALFDETYGYSAWDAVGNPLRDFLTSYLSENQPEGQVGPGQAIRRSVDSP